MLCLYLSHKRVYLSISFLQCDDAAVAIYAGIHCAGRTEIITCFLSASSMTSKQQRNIQLAKKVGLLSVSKLQCMLSSHSFPILEYLVICNHSHAPIHIASGGECRKACMIHRSTSVHTSQACTDMGQQGY